MRHAATVAIGAVFAAGLGLVVSAALFGYANTINSIAFVTLYLALRLCNKRAWEPPPVDEYVHITWSNIAEEYANQLGVKPRPVWISLSEPSRRVWAEADRDRIRVFVNQSSHADDRDVEMMLAHEVAHYTAPPYRGFPMRRFLKWSLLSVSGVMFAACPLWLALPVFLASNLVAALVLALHNRLVELHCDRTALQLTRDVVAAARWTWGWMNEEALPEYLLHRPPRHRQRENFMKESIRLGLDTTAFQEDYLWKCVDGSDQALR